jgi:hypothetical protein
MRLVRNNVEDPRVARDLEMLADAFGDDEAREKASALLAAVEAPVDPSVDDLDFGGDAVAAAGGDPMDDPFVRKFVAGAVHLKRWGPYYLGALLWLGVILFVQPVGRGEADANAVTGNRFAAAPAASSVATDAANTAAPAETAGASFGDYGGAASSSASGARFGDNSTVTPTTGYTAPYDTAPGYNDSPAPSPTVDAGPQPLTITASGYSSRTGGTPAEQNPPNNGLPVASAGNQDAKRSYIKLSGDTTLLRLKLVGDANQNINADAAALKICPIKTANWQPARGQALDSGPAFNADTCQAGKRVDATTWDFDLEQFGRPSDVPGFTITRGAGATGNSFQVVFAPVALPTGG